MTLSAATAIDIAKVTKRYGRIIALDNVSLAIHPGELFALLGPNGAGKTTLIHILCTILRPDAGHARIGDFDVVEKPLRARGHIGVVFQEPSLDDRLTVYENLNFHGMVYGVPARLCRRRIDELLELVELGDWRDRLARSLSSGMKRRLEIARALVHDAEILFLDEPTTGLDAQSRERIWGYLGELRQARRLTVIVTTHYIEEVENFDRVCIIDQGRVLAIDTPLGLKTAYGHTQLRVWPRDETARRAIATSYAQHVEGIDGALVLKPDADAFVDNFLARYGNRVRQLSLVEPSLETVFLTLTGRELRDKAASERQRTFAFGRHGGEHTR